MFVVCAAQLGVGIYLFQLDAIDEVDTIVGKQWNKASVSQVTHTYTHKHTHTHNKYTRFLSVWTKLSLSSLSSLLSRCLFFFSLCVRLSPCLWVSLFVFVFLCVCPSLSLSLSLSLSRHPFSLFLTPFPTHTQRKQFQDFLDCCGYPETTDNGADNCNVTITLGCKYVYVHLHVCVCVCACVYVRVCVFICVFHMCWYVYLCTGVCVCVFVYRDAAVDLFNDNFTPIAIGSIAIAAIEVFMCVCICVCVSLSLSHVCSLSVCVCVSFSIFLVFLCLCLLLRLLVCIQSLTYICVFVTDICTDICLHNCVQDRQRRRIWWVSLQILERE